MNYIFRRNYLGDFLEYGYKGCCTDDGHTKKPPKWFDRRCHDLNSKYEREQQLQCVDCRRPLSAWKPVEFSKKFDKTGL